MDDTEKTKNMIMEMTKLLARARVHLRPSDNVYKSKANDILARILLKDIEDFFDNLEKESKRD